MADTETKPPEKTPDQIERDRLVRDVADILVVFPTKP
jgi:hypothetical protein